jgi:hypothetical protein
MIISRRFTRGGTVKAVYVNGRRYQLRENGQPEDHTLDPRSVRRNLQVDVEAFPISFSVSREYAMMNHDMEPIQVDFRQEFEAAIERVSLNDYTGTTDVNFNGSDVWYSLI